MSMSNWAEQECRIACKRENPNFNFDDEKAWDYGCSCYKSALKAYKSLCEDEHSGYSFSITKNILIRLMEGQPLTPITDDDFPKMEYDPENEWLKQQGLKSDVQCPRMSSLFRWEYMDGKVTYHDNDRAYYINIENPSDTYHSWMGFLDEMFPITMPYYPPRGKYKIYAQSFLVDRKHGDFDTKGILYIETPEGKRVDIDIYETEGDDGKMKRITREEYDELLKRRIDKVSISVADNLLWTLVSNTGSEEEIKLKEKGLKNIAKGYRQTMDVVLRSKCEFFDDPEHWKYNTFHVHQALCNGETDEFKDIPELLDIAEWLKSQKDIIILRGKEDGEDVPKVSIK